jgi:glycosyltransferase involved in cell wall biosynthesis
VRKSVAPKDYVADSNGAPALHLLALPHTQTVKKGYETCAYTQKVVKFCDMMAPSHRVYLYSGEFNDAACYEHIQCVSERERRKDFGNGFDTVETEFAWDPKLPYWERFAKRAIRQIGKRAEKEDLLLLTTSTQSPVSDALPALTAVEWAVGYEGIGQAFCVFESHAWRHHVYGFSKIRDGRAFDTVIPNFFDPADFTPRLTGGQGPLLYMGRLVQRKGPHVAAMIAARMGAKLLVAGPGVAAWQEGRIVCTDGTVVEAPGLEYLGILGREERAEVLARASCLLVPTLYIEPFGGVAVEAMLSGTPVVASDWGAFTETIEEGVTGYRFSTLHGGVRAVEDALRLSRAAVHEAAARYSLQSVQPSFAAYFQQLLTLWGEGWYA